MEVRLVASSIVVLRRQDSRIRPAVSLMSKVPETSCSATLRYSQLSPVKAASGSVIAKRIFGPWEGGRQGGRGKGNHISEHSAQERRPFRETLTDHHENVEDVSEVPAPAEHLPRRLPAENHDDVEEKVDDREDQKRQREAPANLHSKPQQKMAQKQNQI